MEEARSDSLPIEPTDAMLAALASRPGDGPFVAGAEPKLGTPFGD